MSPDKIIYTAKASCTGGRAGLTESDDARVVHRLALAEAMGGKTPGANPEQLFAAGYAACFGSSIEAVARREKVDIGVVTVACEVGIGPTKDGFALAVTLRPAVEGLADEALTDLVQKAHAICPYSNATRGNVDVELDVEGAAS